MGGAFDNLILDSLVVFFTLLFVVTARSFLTIMPKLLASVSRWKMHLEIEDSHQLAWSRNLVFAVFFIPSCLLAQYFSLFNPRFFSLVSDTVRFCIIAGVFSAYLLLRAFLNWQLEMRHFGSRTFIAANRSFRSFWILLFLLLFACGSVLGMLAGDEALVRGVLLHIAGAAYLLHIIGRGQIFSSVCNPFTTILYLCSLELLPTGTLVLSASLL